MSAAMIYGVDYETRTMSGQNITPEKGEMPICDSCGSPCERLAECYWEPGYRVCPECFVHSDEAQCPVLYQQIVTAATAAEINEGIRAHNRVACPYCSSHQFAASAEKGWAAGALSTSGSEVA